MSRSFSVEDLLDEVEKVCYDASETSKVKLTHLLSICHILNSNHIYLLCNGVVLIYTKKRCSIRIQLLHI